MRIIFMGSPKEACLPLDYLYERASNHGYELVGVVSQPAKPVGRGRRQNIQDTPVTLWAFQKGFEVLRPEKASEPEFLERIKALSPDVIITCAYGQILTEAFLEIPKRGTINIHPSGLPRFRGATPIQAALLAGLRETAITILFTVKALDAGNIICQRHYPIHARDSAEILTERLFSYAGPLLLEALEKLKDRNFVGDKQNEQEVTLCKKIKKTDGEVDWSQTTENIYNRFRAYKLFPGSYWFLGRKRILIEEMSRDSEDFDSGEPLATLDSHRRDQNRELTPGTLNFDFKQSALRVRCGDGWLLITQLKPAGQKSLEAKQFWNGYCSSKDY